MDERAQALWRKALQVKGRDWVMAELQRRPGQPNDVVLDVVFQEPLPTRAFCQQWCAEEDNRIIRFSWHKVAIGVALVILVVCAVKAVESRDDAVRQLAGENARMVAGAPAAGRHHSNSTSNNGSGPASTGSRGSTAATTASSNRGTPPSVCAYLTFPTAQCGNSLLTGSGGTTSSNQTQTTGAAYQTAAPASPSQRTQ